MGNYGKNPGQDGDLTEAISSQDKTRRIKPAASLSHRIWQRKKRGGFLTTTSGTAHATGTVKKITPIPEDPMHYKVDVVESRQRKIRVAHIDALEAVYDYTEVEL
jgi:hypothetical protein